MKLDTVKAAQFGLFNTIYARISEKAGHVPIILIESCGRTASGRPFDGIVEIGPNFLWAPVNKP